MATQQKGSEPNKIIYSMVGVSRTFDQKAVLKDISLSYFYGAKIGVIGLNGSGKSTLLRIMAGVEKEFRGEIVRAPGYTIGYLAQEPELPKDATVRSVVEEGVQEVVALLKEFEDINAKFSEPMDDDAMNALLARQGEVQEKLDTQGGWDLDSRLEMAMDALRCPPGDSKVSVLSGGERRRVALCRLLLQKPDILLLDEPTNHLDAETVAWLEHHLVQYEGTVIAVTHDRYFLDNVAGWILELDRGEGIPWKGNYSGWLEQKKERLRQEEKQESERQRTLQRELEWIHETPRARQAKGKARIASYETMLSQDAARKIQDVQIYIPPGPRLGNLVLEARGLRKGYGDTILFDGMDFSVPAGATVGVIGPNGAGKTTLFRIITGQEKQDDGTLKVGETVKLAFVDQLRETLDPAKSVWELISGGQELIKLGRQEVNSRSYIARYAFTGADQQKKVGSLSGGERNRVQLALMLKEEANVLLLDEPTNDLDVNTLRALEEGILGFAGCVLVITHDRWFLDRVATHILAFEDESAVFWHEGNFSDYEENKRARLGDAAVEPHRVKYRHLTR
ncbi:MAG TPA: energy-dependent translational throttle protein EttA [Spirochaetia bacterium]|nr:energy-dependent translational throttle protein EttA [Spirochaetia bacterium]